MSSSERDKSSSGRRTHNCAKCLNHGIITPLLNHKKFCQFKDCPCNKCKIVSRRPTRERSRDLAAEHREEQEIVEPMFDGYDEEHVPEFSGLQMNLPRRSEKRRREFLVEWEQPEAKRGRGSVGRHLTNTRSTITPQDVQQLIDIFPDEDICVLQCIYEACDGDNDVFVQLILKNLRS
ncbi:doublesex- and mab-3-related transcription factor 3-like [Xenia sp. Carnegie-2017]|uniref:doublesex- and mab-3-related transcription factor 3-like n=1 Tax=Xenia sp. Carnegie-2017 TaxID=2897299 RepID=UPI001F04ED77|nr:doublesex- and mab-3-related transcription factor 3-like [Xenia sp. Carnegie-2017]